MLKISLLGKTVFQHTHGQHEPFRKSLRISILGYLIRTGEPVSRKQLSQVFWPHLPDSNSRTYLRNILSRTKDDFSPWLEVDREMVYFNRNSHKCLIDLYELEAVLERYKRVDFKKLNVVKLDEFRKGLSFCDGPFMDGLSRTSSPQFEEWLIQERQFILDQVLRGYKKLINSQLVRKDWQGSITDAQSMIRLDQSNPESWLWLMKCLASSGDLRGAQYAYEKYERVPMADVQASQSGREMHYLYCKIGQRISGIDLDFNRKFESHSTDVTSF
ncbi:MAG: DNA-binding SARP family transcriptional activator [Cellvibrionaceae bacterium]|jgi:DNA-binding SARP family transcriptional activator